MNLFRMRSIREELAYSNLSSYDSGEYKVLNIKIIESILLKEKNCIIKKIMDIEIDSQKMNGYMEYAVLLNYRHSDFQPGIFSERNSYEASFGKKAYYDSETEFIVALFISHHRIHAFCDGNKRTALNLFIDLLHSYTSIVIKDILIIQDGQLLFLEGAINEKEFIKIIYHEMENKMISTNTKCNLEHLIPRTEILEQEDIMNHNQSDRRSNFTLPELEKDAFFYQQLKKPIFQRDTNQWSISKMETLISTFLNDGLIPAIILWEDNSGDIFIIDGAHRISSLLAWVNSDYGKDNELQESNHASIEEYINSRIGSYKDIKFSNDDEYKMKKQIIAKRGIALQWVNGEYEKVKEAFIRINEQGVVISEDEKELIQNDKLPTSILSRAVLSHGLGQKSANQTPITEHIFNSFFKPILSTQMNNYPLAGSLDEEFVISKIYTAFKIVDNKESLDIITLEEKMQNTLRFIQNELEICQKVYFYGITKHHKTNSFYGFIRFSLVLKDSPDLLKRFWLNRERFESYLVLHDRHIQEIARKKRQAKNAYEEISNYYQMVLESCETGNYTELKRKFSYLGFEYEEPTTPRGITLRQNYEESIEIVPKCLVCGGFIDGTNNEEYKHKSCK